MGKGSKRRPQSVSEEEFVSNWDNIFNKATGDMMDLGKPFEFISESDDIEFVSDEMVEAMIQKRFSTEH